MQHIKEEKIFLLDLYIDIQFFSAEDEGRTEDPTARKLEKARSKGSVAKTQDFPGALVLLAGFLIFYAFGQYITKNIILSIRELLLNMNIKIFDISMLYKIYIFILIAISKVLIPIFVLLSLVAILGNVMQFGFLFTTHPLKLNFQKIIPKFSNIMKKMFISKETMFNLFKSTVKVIIAFVIVYFTVKNKLSIFFGIMDMEILDSLAFLANLALKISIEISLLFLIFSYTDYLYRKYEHMEELKMTKQETKDEFKDIEGDPLVKRRIRQKQMELARQRMMSEIPQADVVITNPTHYAVALRFDQEVESAPKVIAKGIDYVALKIIEIAKSNDVPVYQDPPLARAIFNAVDIGEEIPRKFYEAVAKVLQWVYQIKNKVY